MNFPLRTKIKIITLIVIGVIVLTPKAASESTALPESAPETQNWPTVEESKLCGLNDVICPDEQIEANKTSEAKPVATPKNEVEKLIRDIMAEMNFTPVERVLRIARCESGLNPLATNKTSGARGIFQIMPSHKDVTNECAYNAECNIRWSLKFMQAGRWGMWVCK